MREPVVEHSVEDVSKGARVFHMEGVFEGLARVMKKQKQDPRAAEDGNENIQQQKGEDGWLPFLLLRPIKPQQLGKDNEGDRTVAGVEHERKKESARNQEDFFPRHQMLHEKIE
jgi:hypothetical protein